VAEAQVPQAIPVPQVALAHQTLQVIQVLQIHHTHPLKVAVIVQKKIRRKKSLIRLKAYMD
jgi:hypothetical protein